MLDGPPDGKLDIAHEALGVDSPEAVYPQIATLRLAVPYLAC